MKSLKQRVLEYVKDETDAGRTAYVQDIAKHVDRTAHQISPYMAEFVAANYIKRVEKGYYVTGETPFPQFRPASKPARKRSKPKAKPKTKPKTKPKSATTNPGFMLHGDLFEFVGQTSKGTKLVRGVNDKIVYSISPLEG